MDFTLNVPLYPLPPAPTTLMSELVLSMMFLIMIESPTLRLCGISDLMVASGAEYVAALINLGLRSKL